MKLVTKKYFKLYNCTVLNRCPFLGDVRSDDFPKSQFIILKKSILFSG